MFSIRYASVLYWLFIFRVIVVQGAKEGVRGGLLFVYHEDHVIMYLLRGWVLVGFFFRGENYVFRW